MHAVLVDIDDLKATLNEDLKFSRNDQRENMRRIAHVPPSYFHLYFGRLQEFSAAKISYQS